ncbi:30S ribosomal protein S9 [Candidatus Woesearchaeota archaeon]|nr:MAG: 30S ribosomal protein S9 [Candidatus Woesearchaeota archaeon]
MRVINESGKRKRAIARATLKKGVGKIKVNGVLIDLIMPKLARMKMMEPLVLAESFAKEVDINVKVRGGGVMSQADAVRLAIARALNEYSNNRLEKVFLDYDRHLLVADVRRKEVCKPNDSKARAKRQKSYR